MAAPTPTRADMAATAAGTVVVAAGLSMPWLSTRLGTRDTAIDLVELPVARVLMAVTVALAVVATLARRPWVRPAPRLAMLGLAASTVVWAASLAVIAITEVLAVWVSPDRVPDSLRRLAVGVTPGWGPWLTLAGGLLLSLGAASATDAVADTCASLWDRLRSFQVPVVGAAVAFLGSLSLAAARYRPWVEIDSTVGWWSLEGWGLPWAGVLTLVLVWTAAVAACWAVARPSPAAGILLTSAGFLTALPAALVISLSVATERVTAPRWLGDQLVRWSDEARRLADSTPLEEAATQLPRGVELTSRVSSGAVAAYAAGVAIALGGAAIAWSTVAREED